MCFVPVVLKPSPVLPAAVAGNVQLYNKTIILSDCNPRQTAGNNKEEQFRQKSAQTKNQNLLCKQEEKKQSVFRDRSRRVVLFKRVARYECFIP